MGRKKARRETRAEQVMRESREFLSSDWAKRHPARALEELGLRHAADTIADKFGRSTFGTPETRWHASRTRQGALARMYAAGDLSADELAAADEIRTVHERIGRDVGCRTVSLETRVDSSLNADARIFEKLGQVRAEVAYSAWRRQLPHPGLVLAIIIQDVGISIAARHWRMRNAGARQLLTGALALWRREQDLACRTVDAAELAAAHVGLL